MFIYSNWEFYVCARAGSQCSVKVAPEGEAELMYAPLLLALDDGSRYVLTITRSWCFTCKRVFFFYMLSV